ncbi:hypothetical protein VE01_09006 [Pseudogymnoascus verrucosus]|uniref:Uncharacterized protein n=1 Tax=Pseudogymnoascus verrucosus TaxID=342668 RepID=A0A1B8GB11_9PEZI|nr:uncharacterized protein VE01_09006 [Pseudogymnoascus verrucosus]OBT93039.1 hypothetical protein VE01_09006 [Pseudogymnoascus verrucosus]
MGAYLSTLLNRLVGTTTVRHTQQTHTYHDLKAPLPSSHQSFDEKFPLLTTTSAASPSTNFLVPGVPKTDAQLADEFSGLILFSRTPTIFRHRLSTTFPPPPTTASDVSTTSWTSSLALAILHSITAAIEAGVPLGAAKEVVETANRDVEGWIGEHPVMAGVVAMVVALGVLVVVAPWVVEGLGFGGVGVRLGE